MKKRKAIASLLSAVMVFSTFFSMPAVLTKAAATVPSGATLLCYEDLESFAASASLNESSVRNGSDATGLADRLWVNDTASARGGQAKTGTGLTNLSGQIYTKSTQPSAGTILKIAKAATGYKNITLGYDRRVYNAVNATEYALVEWSPDQGQTWNQLEKIGAGTAIPALTASTNSVALTGAEDKSDIWIRFSAFSPTVPSSNGINFAFDNITLSGEAIAVIPPSVTAAPTVTAAAYPNRVDLTWDTVTNATYYTVKQSLSAAGPFSVIATDIVGTAYSVSGLENGKVYYFTVNGNNSTSSGPDSIAAAATPVVAGGGGATMPEVTVAPTVTAVAGDSSVNLSWSTVANATYYTASKGLSTAGPFERLVTNITDTSYLVTGLTNDTTYYFIVSGSNSTSAGPASTAVSATPVAASDIIAQTELYNEIFADYPSSVSKPGADYSSYTPGGINGSGVAAGTTWVKPSGWGRDASLSGSTAPGAPSSKRMAHAYAPGTTQCGMEFTLPNGTSNYKDITVSYDRASWYPKGYGPSSDDYMAVQWSIDGTNWYDVERISKTQATTISGKLTLTPWGNVTAKLPKEANDSSTFKMRFYIQSPTDTNGTAAALNIDWSGIKISGTYLIKDAPQVTYGKARDGYADFAWGAVAGATSYTLKMSTTSGGPYDIVYNNITETTFSAINLTNDVTYYYVISAVGDGGEGPGSIEGTVTPKKVSPDAPTNLTAKGGYKKVALSWDEMDITDYYTVRMSTELNGTYNAVLTNITDTECCINNLANGTTYYFTVTGGNTVGESSLSQAVSAAPTASVAVPSNVTAIPRAQSADISWDTVAGATYYKLYRSDNGTDFTCVNNVIPTASCTDTGLTNYIRYYYRVSAYNPENISEQSQTVTAVPVPKPETVPDVAAVSFDKKIVVSWQAAKDALNYTVKIGTASGNYSATFKDITDTSYTITGLINNTKYYITVSASNYSGEGVNSQEVNGIPMPSPAAPGSVSAAVNENGIKLNWGAVSTATSYTILSRTTKAEDYTVLYDNISVNYFDFTNAEPSKPYLFVIVANNQYGKSGYSSEVSATYGPAMTINSTIPCVTDLKVYDYTNYGYWSTNSDLSAGVQAYPDQSYLITGINDLYKGMYWIQPAAASKSYTGTVLTSFTVTESVYVYAAFDKRSLTNGGTTFPAWITADGWEAVTEYITVNNDLNYSIVMKKFNPGATVTLGNNGGSGYLNYLIFIAPTEHDITISDVTFTDKSGSTVTALKASDQLFAAIKIDNKVNSSKCITIVFALYNENNTMVKYTSMECSLKPMEAKEFGCGIKLPDHIQGYKVKAFIVNSIDEFRTAVDKKTAVLE